ncbi:MAG: T9SS type A sorting domain-containing protein [Chitinophagaceae bacterium]
MKKKIILIAALFAVKVSSAQCWKSVNMGGDFGFALKDDGTLWGWGYNSTQELGDGSTTHRNWPVLVNSDKDWAMIYPGGAFTAGLKTDGSIWVWGYNGFGQYGDGTKTSKSTPTKTVSGTDWKAISCGAIHIVALKKDGTLWGWGSNSDGQICYPTYTDVATPYQIGTDNDWKSISAGGAYTLAIKNDGSLWGWGDNYNGQLGTGTLTSVNAPVRIGTATDWKIVDAGYLHSMGIKNDGSLWAWGANDYGELGDGTTTSTTTPKQIGTDKNWKYISADGDESSKAVKTDGSAWAWGSNGWGELGLGAASGMEITPKRIGSATNWVKIDGKYHTSMGLRSDNTIWSTGFNTYGQLGDGTNTETAAFKSISCWPTAVTESAVQHESVNVFPNPTSGKVTVMSAGVAVINALLVTDMLGRTIRSANYAVPVPHINFDLGEANGLYFVQVTTDMGVQSFRVLKK